jgi:hypothetical protein
MHNVHKIKPDSSGLDPGIQEPAPNLDRRVKPGDDKGGFR